MESAPPTPLEMPEPDLLLEFLIVAFDAPAQLGDVLVADNLEIQLNERARVIAFGGATRPRASSSLGSRRT